MYDDLRLATDSKWMMEHGLEIALKQKDLLGGLSQWQFELAEAKVKRFSSRESIKNETVYYILMANMKNKSVSEFMTPRKIMDN